MNNCEAKIRNRRCGRAKRQCLQRPQNCGEVLRLSELGSGERAQIVSLGCERGPYRRRLLDMGMTRGAVVSIKKVAPLGDPVDIEVRGYELCLRKNEVRNILVKVI